MRRGVSLLEILVGMTILSVAGIAVVAALRQSAQEVDTTSDYTLALGLAQRLVDESLQASLDNPHLSATSAHWGSGRQLIRDGGHPRFAALEDTAAPWGRLDAGPDVAVDARAENLFRLYRDFGLTLAPKDATVPDAPGAPPGLLDISITLDCPGVKDARTFTTPFLLARPQVAPEHAPPVAQDRPGLDDAIRRAFYPDTTGGTLERAVGTADADLALVRDLGAIVVVLRTASDGLDALDRDIANAKTALAKPGAAPGFADWMALARLQEKRSALAWRSLLYCRQPAARIASGFTRAQLGGARAPATAVISGVLRRAASLFGELQTGSDDLLSSYLAARRLNGNASTRPFHQLTLERKILEIAQLSTLLSGGQDLPFVLAWVRYLQRLYRGRNRAVEESLSIEETGAASMDALKELVPVVASRVSQCDAATGDLARLRERLP